MEKKEEECVQGVSSHKHAPTLLVAGNINTCSVAKELRDTVHSLAAILLRHAGSVLLWHGT